MSEAGRGTRGGDLGGKNWEMLCGEGRDEWGVGRIMSIGWAKNLMACRIFRVGFSDFSSSFCSRTFQGLRFLMALLSLLFVKSTRPLPARSSTSRSYIISYSPQPTVHAQ